MPGDVAEIKKGFRADKRFRAVTQLWVGLERALCQLRLADARREEDEK